MFKEEISPYADIIDIPYKKSEHRPHMSSHDRAAQFSPFAALTGYDDAIKESIRLTQSKIELDELEIEKLNRKIMLLRSILSQKPRVTIKYFKPDLKKEGGEYVTLSGNAKKIDDYNKRMCFDDGNIIDITEMIELQIEGENDYEGTDR